VFMKSRVGVWTLAKAACIVPENAPQRQASAQADPALVHQQLDGTVLGLVVHLAAILDPVAQIDVGKLPARGLGDLPEDGVAAQAALILLGSVKGVHRRESVVEDVRYRHGHQVAVLAELEELGEGQVANQEGLE